MRRPLPEPIRIVSGAILLLATLWWLIVALWLAMPAMATEEIEDEWGIHLVEIGEPLEIVDLDWWRLDWSERVLEAGGLTQDFLDEWQAMAELHGCDWPGTTCRTPGPQDEIARSPGRPATIATGSTGGPTVPPSTPSSVESWRSSLAVYAGWDVDRMLRIMACESGGNPSAVSHTDDHGLLQIHYPIWGPAFGVTREQLWDPGINIDIAWRVWSQQGYGAWVCDRG